MNKENILKNIQTLAAMKDLDGATLKNNKPIHYENGYQVASKSMIITRSIVLAAVTIEKNNGNCGIWLENGIYYIDHSHHIKTLTEYDGFTYVENTEEMRVQFIFDGKPDEETRSLLKNWGFRWAPSQGAWQRQLTSNGKYAAKKVIEILQK